ncbi:MAG: glycoside hydrolase family 88 protein [Lachnospiraceae bacterium]|nr:glycoside hydrolase family 88 protein [Lachnospiraceae bacterium]
MHLGEPANETSLKDQGQKKGFYKRDFGIQEWDWPQGVGLYGLLSVMKKTGSTAYVDFLERWFEDNLKRGLPSRNINTTAPLLTLAELLADRNREAEKIKLSTETGIQSTQPRMPGEDSQTEIKEKDAAEETENTEKWKAYERLCTDWAEWLMKELPRTEEGGFQHVTSSVTGDRNAVTLNEQELWIDTLFMAVLFLDKMGQICGRQDWTAEAEYQVLTHIRYLWDPKSGLFYHGWTFKERNNFGGVFWCRGNSWFTLGIPELIEMYGGKMEKSLERHILAVFRAQVSKLKELQAEDGMWHTVLDDDTSYTETSGSAAIAAGMLKGVRLGILGEEYRTCARRAISGIMNQILPDGTVLKVSGGTRIGMDAQHYRDIFLAPMAYGQSLTIMALSEAL